MLPKAPRCANGRTDAKALVLHTLKLYDTHSAVWFDVVNESEYGLKGNKRKMRYCGVGSQVERNSNVTVVVFVCQ